MDYRELLKKYMQHIGEEEGVYFLRFPSPNFTPEEYTELLLIAEECYKL